MLGRLVWVRITQDEMPPTMVASPIYRGPGPLKILSGKGANNGQFERGQLVQLFLTKGGLRLQKALAVTLPWDPW